MLSNRDVCEKITEIFPDIGVCGIDLKVEFDRINNAYIVDLERNGKHLKTFLEIDEANACVDGKQCISFGLQVGELRKNIEELIH